MASLSEAIKRHKAFSALRNLGLSEYETLTYLALIARREATPKIISELTGIPYTKVYEILNRLRSKGWVEVVLEKPLVYAARAPQEVLSELHENFKKRVEETKTILEGFLRETERGTLPAQIYVVRSQSALKKAVFEVVEEAKKELRALIATQHMAEMLLHLLAGREVDVRILARKGISIGSRTGVRTVRGILPLDLLIADEEKMILGLGRILGSLRPKIYGVLISDKEIVETTIGYFDFLWSITGLRQRAD